MAVENFSKTLIFRKYLILKSLFQQSIKQITEAKTNLYKTFYLEGSKNENFIC